MKNVSPANNHVEKNAAQSKFQLTAGRNLTPRQWKLVRSLCVSLLLVGVALTPTISPFAQKKSGPYKVTAVSSRKAGNDTVVTVSADSPLSRTQTWQDEEGFHMSLPGASPGSIQGLPKGVTVRNLGKSLEIVVAVKPGAGVTVDPRFNRLNLIVNGSIDTSQGVAQLDPPVREPRASERSEESLDYALPVRPPHERRPLAEAPPLHSFSSKGQTFTPQSSVSSSATVGRVVSSSAPTSAAPAAPPPTSPQPAASSKASSVQLVPATDEGIAPADPNAAVITVAGDEESGGFFSYVFSVTGVLVLLLIGMVVLMIVRKRQNREFVFEQEEEDDEPEEGVVEVVDPEASVVLQENSKKERRKSARRQSDQALVRTSDLARLDSAPRSEKAIESRTVAPVQPALFGAYRVDQEVGKLILGQAHRLDVLSSRAPDDRRALETSLLKAMNSAEAGEEGRRRAREAMEEYGFVARQCASLLLAHNAYDRASSARALGEINSPSSLPFLLEALYDTETIVRTEAVTSLGTLKMPSSIGALLDMARRHPEMPAALVSRALSACTFDCFDISFDDSMSDRLLLDAGDPDSYLGEITHLDSAAAVEALPEWFEDEDLSEALARLQDTDVEARAAAARRLAQFPVQSSVEALTAIAANDAESAVRSAAVTSLGEIEHGSVFAPVLMAFADEAREVRAAAARSLSRMNFDRSEGFVRLIETADAETLSKVASACIKAGMVGQAIDRIISEDRRLAYEAFSMLSLLAKANELEPLLDAIASHEEVKVRLALVRLLGTTGQPEVATHLRHLAVRDGMPEKVSSALMEVVYKMDQAMPV